MSQSAAIRMRGLLVVVLAACAGWAGAVRAEASAGDAEPSFSREIRPILAEACFPCHGFDAGARRADLRLDTFEGATADLDEGTAIAPGDPDSSEAWRRITDDSDDRMPPADAVRQLDDGEIDLIRRWIESGAEYEPHWAFIPPQRPAPPDVSNEAWVRNPIDRFILTRLESEGLGPSPEASPARLIRRLSLDLRGIPPTVEEVDDFLADDSAGAYERLVESFLASPRYGERMAWDWLEAARYADSNGYQGDAERTMWPWRDWVVEAFNDNMPYDEFTLWQIAGDLLPDATHEQRLATGFNRNHMINGEGGRIAEENRVEYIFDQVETVGTVWLGLTFNCARCHDHKFDPITQADYYEMFDFFNRTAVTGEGGNPQTPPVIEAPDAGQAERLAGLREQIGGLDERIARRIAEIEAEREDRERRALDAAAADPWHALAPDSYEAEHQELTVLDDGSILAGGPNPDNDTYTLTAAAGLDRITGVRLEAIRHESLTDGGLSRSGSGNFVLTGIRITLTRPGEDEPREIEIAAADATFEQEGHPVAHAFDRDSETGWAVWEGRTVDRDHQAVFRFAEPVSLGPDARLTIVLEHRSQHANHNLGRFRLSITDDPAPPLTADHRVLLAALETPADQRDEEQAKLVTEHLHDSDEALAVLRDDRRRLRRSLDELSRAVPKVMVMADTEQRTTYILDNGFYANPRDEVTADTPHHLPPMADPGAPGPRDRLGLARWIIDSDNPLTARVTVNRLWMTYFGRPLVPGPEDFGTQSDPPSHPDLLDYLATEFLDSGWDLKHMVRLIVSSAAYRQSSRTTPELLERDPDNELVARGPRFRMPSWMMRDQALFASGLMSGAVGGEPVMPYQPEGVWEEATFGTKEYKRDSGEPLYRRSLYVFWRRIVGPTMFFDAATRQVCTVKQTRTNTPLHALTTLNDTTYIEAARALAERVLLDEATGDDEARVELAFRLVLARTPNDHERRVLGGAIERLRTQYAADPTAAETLVRVGDSKPDPSLDPVEHAAWTGVCTTILNLDEALSKE